VHLSTVQGQLKKKKKKQFNVVCHLLHKFLKADSSIFTDVSGRQHPEEIS
jgi:hypothetical protein